MPLADIIRNRDATGRVAKWAIELGPYHITYEPRTSIKSQALVDFVNDWTDFTSSPNTPCTKYCTNNMAEYEAMLHGLRLAKEMNIKRIRFNFLGDLESRPVKHVHMLSQR